MNAAAARRPSKGGARAYLQGMTAISARGLVKTFGEGRAERRVLDSVDLEVTAGEVVAILGRSGSGKSTLLSLIGLFDRADEGQYFLHGNDITKLPERRAAALRSAEFGFVFQRFFLLKHLTAAQNVAMALVNGQGWSARRKRRQQVMEALETVGIAHLAKSKPSRLSGGEQQRVAIARALISRPTVLFADEPTGNLDSASGAEILALLREAVELDGQTTLMVTHDPRAAAVADRVVFIADGRIVADLTEPTEADVLAAVKEAYVR